MKSVLICCLTYGSRPLDTLFGNLTRAGYPATVTAVNLPGIANAQNEAIDRFHAGDHDVLAFLSNDITEPEGWLRAKVHALKTYPQAGVVASSLETTATGDPHNELIISNWALNRECVKRVGYFDDEMHPYGPIDLEYCQRVWAAGLKTYYVIGLRATHQGGHATGDEYGWNKEKCVAHFMARYHERTAAVRAGKLSPHRGLRKQPETFYDPQ